METKREFTEVAIQMGYAELRTQACGGHLALGNDIFIGLPTGNRISLRYSLLPGIFYELRRLQSLSFAFVVSPLAVLMRERELRRKMLSKFSSVGKMCYDEYCKQDRKFTKGNEDRTMIIRAWSLHRNVSQIMLTDSL